jgi:hypothetical protein
MATVTTSAVPVPNTSASRVSEARARTRRRSIDPRAGRALEILGHSIEYLVDECLHRGANLGTPSADTDAIRLLMALNRQVYFECPEVPSWGERLAVAFRSKLG